MNPLESNLILWAICSILLCEILIIIGLFRFCFNRVRAKKFYVKKEEYEYLEGTPAILRPPPHHADQLAAVGTIRHGGIENLAFYREPDDSRSTPHWIELQTTVMPPTDYEINSDDYLSPQSLRSEDRLSQFHFQTIRRSDIYLPTIQRLDTSTESPAIHYTNILPKSILKGSPPSHLHSSRTSSKFEESPRTSVRIKIEPSIFDDSLEESRPRINIPSTNDDDDEEEEQRPPTSRHISRVFIPWERHLTNEPIFVHPDTERQALEY